MSIIGDALQRAERDGAPLDAPKPADAVPQRPMFDRQPTERRSPAVAPDARVRPVRRQAGRRVSPATVVLMVLAAMTVYMLADPRWSGSNWGIDQYLVTPGSIDANTPVHAEAVPSPAMTASTLSGDSIAPPSRPQVPANAALQEATPTAAMEAPLAESASAAASPEQPVVAAARPELSGRYVLSGVMLGGSTRLAVINGAIVEIGQMIDGAEVVAISRRDVTLSISGKKVRIAMQAEGFMRQEPGGLNPPRRPGPG